MPYNDVTLGLLTRRCRGSASGGEAVFDNPGCKAAIALKLKVRRSGAKKTRSGCGRLDKMTRYHDLGRASHCGMSGGRQGQL